MVTIKRIEIKGFFGKGDFEWNLDPVVNILGGKNGSGKSSIFRLCYLMLKDKCIIDGLDKKYSAIFDTVTLSLNNNWKLKWTKVHDDASYLVNNEGSFRIGAVTLFDDKGNMKEIDNFKDSDSIFFINSFEKETRELIKDLQNQKYILNNGITTLDSMIDKQINFRNKNLSAAVDKYMDESANEIAALNEYKKKHNMINTSLSHFMTEYDKKISSDFVFSKKGEKIPWQSLSMGEKQILLLLLMVSNTQQQPCVFFMDEPDLSMHIDWKEILVKELHELNPNMQIILSTHAPSVITGWHDKVKEVNQLIKK